MTFVMGEKERIMTCKIDKKKPKFTIGINSHSQNFKDCCM